MYRSVTFFCSVHVRLLHCKMRDMFCCGKLCTLVLSLWDFTFYSCKGDADIMIQRRHIKLGKNELKRQFATTDRWAAGTEATKLFSAEFHPNVALTTQNGVAKTYRVVIGLTYGFVHVIYMPENEFINRFEDVLCMFVRKLNFLATVVDRFFVCCSLVWWVPNNLFFCFLCLWLHSSWNPIVTFYDFSWQGPFAFASNVVWRTW